MNRYSPEIKFRVRKLRSEGDTYSEISRKLEVKFPKSTLYELCKGIILPQSYIEKVGKLNFESLKKAQAKSWKINKIKREAFFMRLNRINNSIAKKIKNQDIAKISLAMLCLGEASKYSRTGSSFYLGSSNPKIVVLFLSLLKKCFDFKIEKVRATVQCRADQNAGALEKYWQRITKIPRRLFYKALIDPRTVGKPTKKKGYKGVLRVDYFDTKIQLELESLADLIYNQVSLGPVAQR